MTFVKICFPVWYDDVMTMGSDRDYSFNINISTFQDEDDVIRNLEAMSSSDSMLERRDSFD